MGSFLSLFFSKYPEMPAWDQRVPVSGHMEESETAKKVVNNYATSRSVAV